MTQRIGSVPPSHLHVLHGEPAAPPRSIAARGILYWTAAILAAVNAATSTGLAIYGSRAGVYGPVILGESLCARLPLGLAALALLIFHSPAALTLLTFTLGLIQALDFGVGILHRDPIRIGVPLALAVSTLAISIPLLAEQALKRQRWLRGLQARLPLRR